MGLDCEIIVVGENLPDAEKLRPISSEFAQAFPNFVWLDKKCNRHALNLKSTQQGQKFIQVSTLARYYGIGCERGPLPTIICALDWLQSKFPTFDIFYLSDSHYIDSETIKNFEKYTDSFRKNLWNHFVECGHRPYNGTFNLLRKDSLEPFCDWCQCHLYATKFSNGSSGGNCPSCQREWNIVQNSFSWKDGN